MVHIRFLIHAKIFHNLVSDIGLGDCVLLSSVSHHLYDGGGGGGGDEGQAGEEHGVYSGDVHDQAVAELAQHPT